VVANADHYHWNYAAEDLRTKKIILAMYYGKCYRTIDYGN
jgi:hypothetical protein